MRVWAFDWLIAFPGGFERSECWGTSGLGTELPGEPVAPWERGDVLYDGSKRLLAI
jgi:hypothetical protein